MPTTTAIPAPSPDVPTRHRMRLVERLIEEDTGDFAVEAPTPALAAGILLAAHAAARERCSNTVGLPDGQSCRIEPTNVVENQVFCLLLDERGQELEEVEPEWPAPRPNQVGLEAEGTCAPASVSRTGEAGR